MRTPYISNAFHTGLGFFLFCIIQIASFTSFFASVLPCCIFAIEYCLDKQWPQTLCSWESPSPLEVKAESLAQGHDKAVMLGWVRLGKGLWSPSCLLWCTAQMQWWAQSSAGVWTLWTWKGRHRDSQTPGALQHEVQAHPCSVLLTALASSGCSSSTGTTSCSWRKDRRRVEPDVVSSVSTICLYPHLPGLVLSSSFQHCSR